MADNEWQAVTEPDRAMQERLGAPDWRRLYLFAAACLRRILGLIHEEGWQRAAEVALGLAGGDQEAKDVEAAAIWAERNLHPMDGQQSPEHPYSRSDFWARFAVFQFLHWRHHEAVAVGVAQAARRAVGRQAWHTMAQEGREETYSAGKAAQDAAIREEARCQAEAFWVIFPHKALRVIDPQ